jgi:hypothetical protein
MHLMDRESVHVARGGAGDDRIEQDRRLAVGHRHDEVVTVGDEPQRVDRFGQLDGGARVCANAPTVGARIVPTRGFAGELKHLSLKIGRGRAHLSAVAGARFDNVRAVRDSPARDYPRQVGRCPPCCQTTSAGAR